MKVDAGSHHRERRFRRLREVVDRVRRGHVHLAEADTLLRARRDYRLEELYLPLRERVLRVIRHRAVREDSLAVEVGELPHLAYRLERVLRKYAEAAHAGIELEVDARRLFRALRGIAYELCRRNIGHGEYDTRLHHRRDFVREYRRENLHVRGKSAALQNFKKFKRLERLSDTKLAAARLCERLCVCSDTKAVSVRLEDGEDAHRLHVRDDFPVVPNQCAEIDLDAHAAFQRFALPCIPATILHCREIIPHSSEEWGSQRIMAQARRCHDIRGGGDYRFFFAESVAPGR